LSKLEKLGIENTDLSSGIEHLPDSLSNTNQQGKKKIQKHLEAKLTKSQFIPEIAQLFNDYLQIIEIHKELSLKIIKSQLADQKSDLGYALST